MGDSLSYLDNLLIPLAFHAVPANPGQLVLTTFFVLRLLFISAHTQDAGMEAKFCICTFFSGIMGLTSRSNRCV